MAGRLSDTKKVVKETLDQLKRSGYLMEQGPMYVDPEKHKEHHDLLEKIMPWAEDFSKGFRKRVISAAFFFLLLISALFAWLATDVRKIFGIGG